MTPDSDHMPAPFRPARYRAPGGSVTLAAVAELRGLVVREEFGAAEQMLGTLRDASSATTVDTLR
jgi:hypothetical protein